ncbi:hypothetical protein [Nonomuraea phyllanthi]|nr:hypothetical protein [Nonomuraea phyllanthi]
MDPALRPRDEEVVMVHALQPSETAPEGVEVREPVGADGPDGGPAAARG